MKYNLQDIETTIELKEWKIKSVVDDYASSTCVIYVLLITDNVSINYPLYGFEYSDTWEDADIENFIETKLKEYEIK